MQSVELTSDNLPGPEKIDKEAAAAAIATISSVGIAVGLSFPLLSILLEAKGYSSALIGANTAMAGLASIIAVPFVTKVTRTLGLVNTLVISAVVASISLLGFYFLPYIEAWFVLRILFHAAITFSFVLSEFWINSCAPERKRGLLLGVYVTVLSIGFACGPGILAIVGSKGLLPFALGSVIILLSNLPAILARANQPMLHDDPTSLSVFRYIWIVPAATFASFIFGFVEQSGLALFPVFGAQTGYSERAIALLLVCLAMGNVVFQIPLGILGDRLAYGSGDRRPLLIACASVGAVGAAILPWITYEPFVLAFCLFIWGGVVAGMYTIGLAHLGSRMRGTELAQANAAFVLCYAIGMFVGPQLVGIIMDLFPPYGFSYSICFMFILYVIAITLRKSTKPDV